MARPKKEGALDKPIMVRVDPDVHQRLMKIAQADERTLANTVRRVIDRGLPVMEEELARAEGDARLKG